MPMPEKATGKEGLFLKLKAKASAKAKAKVD
jgi:hypothetical protein